MIGGEELEALCELARSRGACGVRTMDARGVVLDPRVRLKCMVPMCDHYGRNLMCPPNVMPLQEFSEVLKRYSWTILVQYPIPLHHFAADENARGMEQAYADKDYSQQLLRTERAFIDLMGLLEKEAMRSGHRFATAFSGGACRLCDECIGQGSGQSCRHPFRARPAMEAMGIDVYETAKNAGLPFDIPPKDRPVLNGLLLVH